MAESKYHTVPGFVYCTKCQSIRHQSNRCSHDQKYWKLVYQRSFAAQKIKDAGQNELTTEQSTPCNHLGYIVAHCEKCGLKIEW
jgi:hypothetical protein